MGSGVGASSFPALLQYLLDMYTWRGALLITGGIAFHMCISAAVSAQPNTGASSELRIAANSESKTSTNNNNDFKDEKVTATKKTTSVFEKFISSVKNKVFLLYTLSVVMTMPCINSILIFLVDYLEVKGIDRATVVLLFTYTNLTSIAFRILPGTISQMMNLPTLVLPCLVMWLASATILMYPFAETTGHFTVLSIVYGICKGSMVNLMPVVTFQLVGLDNYSTALGVLFTLTGITNAAGGPISGNHYKCSRRANFR